MRSLSWNGAARLIVTFLTWLGWLLLAYAVGLLVAALISNGWLGLLIGSGGLVVAVVLIPRLGRRRAILSDRLSWSVLLLVVLALLLAANRNTTMGSLPGRTWVALLLAGAGLVVSVGGLRRRGQSRAGPRWAAVILSALVGIGIAIDAFGAYRSESVAVTKEDIRLSGTLLLPRQEGPFPMVVFIHGSGPGRGFEFRAFGDRLARQGVAALLWDKRGSGDSVGGSPHDSFDELASDVVALVEAMGQRADIDQAWIGLWGQSEGAWIAAMAAQQLDGVAAMVLESPGVGFGDTVYYEHAWRLRNAGVSETDSDRAVRLRHQINHYYRTAGGRAELISDLEEAMNETWYESAVDVGLLPWPADVASPDDRETIAFMERQDFTLLTALSSYRGPVLASFGLKDQCNPAERNAEIIEDALTAQGNDHVVLRYPNASHVMVQWLVGASCGTANTPPVWYPPGYVDDTTGWLADQLRR